jgi:hypothetical protein
MQINLSAVTQSSVKLYFQTLPLLEPCVRVTIVYFRSTLVSQSYVFFYYGCNMLEILEVKTPKHRSHDGLCIPYNCPFNTLAP